MSRASWVKSMAKRSRPRSEAPDAATATPSPSKVRRARGESAAQRNDESIERPEPLNAPAETAPQSKTSEPSDEEIRHRAYQRYLERGGGHGMDFEDWLAAERELKGHKPEL